MKEAQPLDVAVIGAGHLGRHHVRLAATLPGWRCVGVMDTDPARRQAVCSEYGVPALASLEEAVARAEAAVIATPTVHHRQMAGAFLAAGRHVLVEKPITSSLAEADELIQLAAAHQVVLAVGHVEFFNPAVQAVLARRPRPRYLEAQRLSPFTRRSLDIDVVLDLMVHDIQLAQALNPGFPVREVRAAGVPVLSGRVDLANVRLEDEVEDALALMQRTGSHLARVITPEGETAGILFLEDVLEELVGEINDVTQSPRRFRPA